MICSDDKKLYEYIDGVLESDERREVEEHLRECSACQKNVVEMKEFEKDLKIFWKEFRKECPSPEDMYDYSLGKLDKENTERISLHLSNCHICKMKNDESERMAEEFKELALSSAGAEAIPVFSLADAKKKALANIVGVFIELVSKSKNLKQSLEEIWRNTFSYTQPIGLKALQPTFGQILERADIGEGYERQIIQEEGSAFEIEFAQFGSELNIIFHTSSEWFKYSIIRFEIYEEERKYSGMLSVIDGVGKITLNLEGKDIQRPEIKPYRIKIDAISSIELLADLTDPKSSRIFAELSKSGNAEIEKLLAELMGKGKAIIRSS
jgi:hypothetical protein